MNDYFNQEPAGTNNDPVPGQVLAGLIKKRTLYIWSILSSKNEKIMPFYFEYYFTL